MGCQTSVDEKAGGCPPNGVRRWFRLCDEKATSHPMKTDGRNRNRLRVEGVSLGFLSALSRRRSMNIHREGVKSLYFAILFCATLEISNMTPPFAYSAFYLKTIAPKGLTMADIYRACIPFFFVNTGMVILLLIFPPFIMWLPSLMR